MSRRIKAGSTDQSVVLRIIDSTDGTPETGVVWDTAGIDFQYRRELAASVAITEATLAALTTAHADGGFLHIGNGYYRLDLPDAAVAAGVTGVLVHGVVTGMIVIGEYIELVDYDPYDGTRLGLTALPNAAADAVGGLPISDAGGLDLDAKLANTNEVTAARMAALTDWINGGRLDLILDIIAVDVAGLDGAAMVGTDGAALASAYTAARAAYLDELAAANIPADLDATLADTNELQGDWVNGGRLDLLLDAVLADTGELQTDWVNGGRLDLLLDAVKVVTDKMDSAQSEPTGVPAENETPLVKVARLYMEMRNKVTTTTTKKTVFDDGGAAEYEYDISDDGTYTESEANVI